MTVTSHRGNDITKTGTQENPAVHIERSGNDVVKTASELKVEQKGPSQNEDGTWDTSNGTSSSANKEEPKRDEEKLEKNGVATNGTEKDAQVGDKRKAAEIADATTEEVAEPVEEEKDAKKLKTTNGAAANGETKKKAGRPKGGNGAKKEKAAPRTGTAARKTRSQGKAE